MHLDKLHPQSSDKENQKNHFVFNHGGEVRINARSVRVISHYTDRVQPGVLVYR